MTEWAVVLTPLLVLFIVLLFRFVGCGLDVSGQLAPKPPSYPDYILGKPTNTAEIPNFHHDVKPNGDDVIAYWRLLDPAADTVAKDEKTQHNGEYRETEKFEKDQPSLIASDAPSVKGRFFDGGFVMIREKSGVPPLYTENFTIEAWVLPSFAAGSERVLFHAGGQYVHPFNTWTQFHGFRIFATSTRTWQVSLLPKGDVFESPPLIPPGGVATHVAVTVQNAPQAKKKVTLFIDGNEAASVEVLSYSTPSGAPMLIGVGSDENSTFDVGMLKPHVSRPIQSRVQEVVLHKKALLQPEIKNHFLLGKFKK
jgi:hypothetical protein